MSAYIGRYHRVRPLGPNGWGAPYVFDRGRAQHGPRLIPAPYDRGDRVKGGRLYEEWYQSPEGLWMPTLRGGAGGTYISSGETVKLFLLRQSADLSQTALGLDSNYVNATSGDAIATRFAIGEALTLSKIYFYITTYTGTAANVNDLNCEFRNDNATTGPGATLHDSVTVNPASATGWIGATWVTGFTLVADTFYWPVVGDADGNITDFATVLQYVSSPANLGDIRTHPAVRTTDGWASVRTFPGALSAVLVLFTSGKTLGSPFATSAASTSSTNQRGLRFIAPAELKLFGAVVHIQNAGLSGINLWAGANGPGGTADAVGTLPIAWNSVGVTTEQGFAFGTPPTLAQGTAYRLVLAYASAATVPYRWQIGTGADATLRSAMLGGGNWYWAEANGTTDWSNDNISEFPAMDVIVEDFVTASAGGGGLRMAGHGGLAA